MQPSAGCCCVCLHLPAPAGRLSHRQKPACSPSLPAAHPLPQCVGDAQFGCSMAKNDSCCGYPLRVCEPSMSGFQCKKGWVPAYAPFTLFC